MEANGSGGGGEMNEEPLGLCLSGYVDQGSVESHRYYLSRRTVMEMLKDRGFSVPTSDVNLTLNDFRAIHGQTPEPDRLRFSVTHLKDPSKRILVIFCGPGVVKVNSVRSIAAQIVNKDTLTGLILILESQMTNQAQKSLDLLPFKVEIFQITDLLVNITKHVLKPKYEFLNDQQKQRLLKKYSIEEKQLPRMLKQDAIARYYALQKGQVVKISYSGGISENYVTYRCVWLLPERSHMVLVEMVEQRKELEKKTKPILDTFRFADKKTQYVAAVKYLEYVLQSALAPP